MKKEESTANMNPFGSLSGYGGIVTSTTNISSEPVVTYNDVRLVDHFILKDRVELVYRATRITTNSSMFCGMYQVASDKTEEIVYKDVIKFKDGKTVVDRVYGEYIPAADETYEFKD